MKNLHFFLLFSCVVASFLACKPKDAPQAVVSAELLKYEPRNFLKQYCVNDNQCADFNIIYLVMNGDPALAAAVNKTIQSRTVAGLNGNQNIPFEVALDSVGMQFLEEFIQLKRDVPGQTQNQTMQMTSSVSLQNSKVLTLRQDFFFSTGGAHPNTASALMSFDLQKEGKLLTATDLLHDTNAVLPLLEKAYKKAKQLAESDDIGQLLLTENKKLPLPANVGIVPEGILFAYNDYEVAPHVVGPADILLTWEELGSLADKSKWF